MSQQASNERYSAWMRVIHKIVTLTKHTGGREQVYDEIQSGSKNDCFGALTTYVAKLSTLKNSPLFGPLCTTRNISQYTTGLVSMRISISSTSS